MTPEMIVQLVMTFGVIPGLFVWLLFDTRSEHKKDKDQSQKREEKLMSHLDKVSESTEKIANSLDKMEMRMERIERQVGL